MLRKRGQVPATDIHLQVPSMAMGELSTCLPLTGSCPNFISLISVLEAAEGLAVICKGHLTEVINIFKKVVFSVYSRHTESESSGIHIFQ